MKVVGILAAVAGLAAAVNANAGDPRFLDFVVDSVHKRQFYGCDGAIRDVFANVGGDDIRVNTDLLPGVTDTIIVTAAWGDPGDTVLVREIFRKSGSTCWAIGGTLLVETNSCQKAAADGSQYWNFVASAGSSHWYKNAGQSDLVLLENGGFCALSYFTGRKFPLDK
jgi:hypothetical protein